MLIKVRVKANAKKESLIELDHTRLQIAVREEASDNAANRRVIVLVAHHYRVAPKDVRLIHGHTAPSKLFEIRD